MKIKAIALDVDGVLIGQRHGYNSPKPHSDVLQLLRSIHESGVYIVLVTAKLHHSIHNIARDANLLGYHVADGGAVLINVLNNDLSTISINEITTRNIVQEFQKENIYTCFYTSDDYYVQDRSNEEITRANSAILLREPKLTNSIQNEILGKKVTKIMPIVSGDKNKVSASQIFENLHTGLTLHWAKNPMAPTYWFGFITAAGVTKLTGLQRIVDEKNIELQNVLGVGDSDSDLVFIDACGFGAAMGNASSSLKKRIKERGKSGFIGPSVDENGIIDILKYFITI